VTDQAGSATEETALRELEAEVAGCLGRPTVSMRVAPAGGAGHVAYEVHDPADPGGPIAFYRAEGGLAGRRYGLRREAAVLPVAAGLGWPVPHVLGTPGDPPGLLMNLVAGTSRPAPEEIEPLAAEYLRLLADVHAADAASFPIEQYETMAEAVGDDLRWWTDYAEERGALDEPLLRIAARVLAFTLPTTDEAPSLVHGDAGAGNFMIDAGTISAVIDWELAHVGDPHEDLAWLWMRGAHTSFGDPQQRLAEYEAAAGRTLDADRLRWHLAFVMWKSCVGMYADLHRPPTSAALVQSIVILTYDALLGSQLMRVLGGSLQLLGQEPVRRVTPATQPADRMLAATELSTESRLIVTYLREASAQGDWERARFDDELRSLDLPPRNQLLAELDALPDERLLDVTTVLARAADRAAMALPNAVRRIERAQKIGLGTTAEPTERNR
jgi:aminoglycoside phosphotransferase